MAYCKTTADRSEVGTPMMLYRAASMILPTRSASGRVSWRWLDRDGNTTQTVEQNHNCACKSISSLLRFVHVCDCLLRCGYGVIRRWLGARSVHRGQTFCAVHGVHSRVFFQSPETQIHCKFPWATFCPRKP